MEDKSNIDDKKKLERKI